MNLLRPKIAAPFRPALRCLLLMILVVVTFSGFSCSSIQSGSGPLVIGTGDVKSESRSLDAFTSIDMSGSFDTEWAPGDASTAVIEAQENLLPHLKTEVDGGTLKIYTDCSITTTAPIKIKLTGKSVDHVTLSGSGDLTATGMTGPALDATLSGSGDIALSGAVQDLNLVVSGSGTVSAGDLKAATADVTISGSGDVSVNASEKLSATVAGSGTVTYQGNPKTVNKQITGSGDVVAK